MDYFSIEEWTSTKEHSYRMPAPTIDLSMFVKTLSELTQAVSKFGAK